MGADYIAERIKKLEQLKSNGIDPYPQLVLPNKKFCSEIVSKFDSLKPEERADKKVVVAGRIMRFRRMGKITFAHIQDESGQIQVVFQKNNLKDYNLLKLFDLGDIIAVKGFPFRTKRGELSIDVVWFELAAKAIRPLPEKYHGIKDDEIRLRKRYLDAIMNRELLDLFKKKTKIIKSIRAFMDKKGFVEVQTPILQLVYGGASAEPFTTHHNALDIDVYLRISTELHLKRMIVAGFEKIYEIGPVFRNEGMDASHLQEIPNHFEFYWAYQNYEGLMNFTEEFLSHVIKEVNGSLKVEYEGEMFDFTPPYPRIKFRDLILEKTGIDIDKYNTFEALKKEIKRRKVKGVDVDSCKSYSALLDEFYKRTCRPFIKQPTFLTHYPTEMIPLAKRNKEDGSKINTFQLLVNGWELVKAYDELNDPIDQRKRFEEQQEALNKGDKEAHPFDEEFVEAMEYGMPPLAGFGLGIDRFVTFLLNLHSVRESVFFPLMRPEK